MPLTHSGPTPGDGDHPCDDVIGNTLLHVNAAILEDMLWQEVSNCYTTDGSTALVHLPDSLPAVAISRDQDGPSVRDSLLLDIANTPPPPSAPPLSLSSLAPAPVDDHTLALQFASSHPGEFCYQPF